MKKLSLWVGAVAICAAVIWACGPDFPNMLLSEGDRAVQIAPIANFGREIKRLNQHRTPYKYVAPLPDGDSSTVAELADLRMALQKREHFWMASSISGSPITSLVMTSAQGVLRRLTITVRS